MTEPINVPASEAVERAMAPMVDRPGSWLVLRKCETDPAEAWRGDRAEMEDLFDRLGTQWSETFLLRVVVGPPAAMDEGAGRIDERNDWPALLAELRAARERIKLLEPSFASATKRIAEMTAVIALGIPGAACPNPAEHLPCRCGSGGHPRHCLKHPLAFARHVAELNYEGAKDAQIEAANTRADVEIEMRKAEGAKYAVRVAAFEAREAALVSALDEACDILKTDEMDAFALFLDVPLASVHARRIQTWLSERLRRRFRAIAHPTAPTDTTKDPTEP